MASLIPQASVFHPTLHTVKKLEVDLTTKMSSQLQCGFIQVQMVVHLLLPWFKVTPVKVSGKQ